MPPANTATLQNPVIHEGRSLSQSEGGHIVDREALVGQRIFSTKVSARYHWCTEYANVSWYRRFFIPMKGERPWYVPQRKHNDCNPTGCWGNNSIFLRSSTVSCSKHSIRTCMWCYIDTFILHNVDPHRSIFQETICSRPVLKWPAVIPVGFLPAALPVIVIYQSRLQIFFFELLLLLFQTARRRSKKKCSSSIKVHGWGKLISRVLSLFRTGSNGNHSAMNLLHLGPHCLDAAQNLILVCNGSNSNSGQVTVWSKKEEAEGWELWVSCGSSKIH